ncbi:mitochondrial carrier domain-containing protein [Lipomyces tetrasporus]|uniref:Mitochondrial carrier domain-containing protein n=1 Tax=Lipomyces tetrasporus TaxID=54092 RepID=A0AAD7QXH3_9ASCO|nr:mitochondrial carrier domain-containing protein [Lipomyces tetrasporus]KAJ8103170.1 mitochondrial carrier domain-containing protein [Lipomyces tetrasporus]
MRDDDHDESKRRPPKRDSFVSATADITNRESIICGGLAGLTSRFFVAPLDVVKIRLQLQTNSFNGRGGQAPLYRGTISSMAKIYKNEGLTALWRGNLPAELLYLLYGSIQFTTFHQANLLMNTYASEYMFPGLQQFITGAASGAVATTVTYPLDLLRTRFAAQGNDSHRVYQSLRHSIQQIHADEGIAGFFRGLRPTVSSIVPHMGIFFGTYVPLKGLASRISDDLNLKTFGSDEAIAGMIAGTISKTGVFPLDVIRKRMQVQGPTLNRYVMKDIPTYPRSILGCAKMILVTEGYRGLYRGLWVSLIKAAPASAITMWTFEHSVTALRWYDTKTESFRAS